MNTLVKTLAGSGVAAASIFGYFSLKERFFESSDRRSNPILTPSCKEITSGDNVNVANSSLNRANVRESIYCKKCAKIDKKLKKRAVRNGRKMVQRLMLEQGIPGGVVAVAKDGVVVWSEGFGLADVENDTPCTNESVMRIASISKPLTAVALLQLYEKGLVDLDAPIQTYVPFPKKTFGDKEVTISVRHLLSHLGGIRHYQKANEKEKKAEFQNTEYYIKQHFDSLEESIKLFADDDLMCEPGTRFHYSSHGWTLVSAVVEKVSGQNFLQYMREHVLDPLSMSKTRAEVHPEIIYGRAKHYVRSKNGDLKNTPFVDLSYKWAGGGFISSAEDLLKFGCEVLACWQLGSHIKTPQNSLLSHSTTALMLTPVVEAVHKSKNKLKNPLPLGYGLGWFVREEKEGLFTGKRHPFYFGHSGGAVGASSILLVMPSREKEGETNQTIGIQETSKISKCSTTECLSCGYGSVSLPLPRGVVVAVIFNLQKVKGVFKLGTKLAEEFQYSCDHAVLS